MEGDVFLSRKEARRVYIMEQVVAGKLTVAHAAQVLDLCERQVKRLKKGVLTQGVPFLAHKNRGRKPKHALPPRVRDLIVARALAEFKGASCNHMADLLARFDHISVSPRSIRRILGAAGIPNPHSHKAPRRRRSRERMPQAGLLVQCDASDFAWLEDRGPKFTLHGAIDDATSMVLGLYFRPTEDLHGYLQLLRQVVVNHGVPRSLYSDRHTIFFSPKKDKLSLQDELAGKKVSLTQFGQALEKFGIIHIPARSPQAKGRIERLWRTLQANLLIELRVAGISSLEQANAFLPAFIAWFNAKFAVPPAQPESAFSPPPAPQQLQIILSLNKTRQASHGSTISYDHHLYHLVDSKGSVLPLPPKAEVQVLTHLDGSLNALYNHQLYALKEFTPSPAQPQEPLPKTAKTPAKPAPNHPWRQSAKPIPPLDPVAGYFYGKDPSYRKAYAQT